MEAEAPPGDARSPRRFPTTRWTLILASRGNLELRRRALEDLLALYWMPLYAYARRKGLSVEASEDAVQGFCLKILEGDWIDRLDPDKGRLRSYLRTSLDRHLIHLHEKESARKRGGGQKIVPLDVERGERHLVSGEDAPDAVFDREWALGVMERALARLRGEYEKGRRKGAMDVVLRFFSPSGAPPTYAEAAASGGMTQTQLKASLHRARRRFRELVREEIADTVADASDVDRELAELLRLLRR